MKHTLLHRLATGIVVFGTFFSAAPFAHATTLTLPQQYNYPGLSFSQPLTFVNPLSVPQPTETISFAPQKKLTENTTITNTPSALTLSPTQTKTGTPTLAIIKQQPTPTIYSKQTKTQNITANPTPTQTPRPTAPAIATPTPLPATSTPQSTGGVSADKLFSMVNSYRQAKGLAALQKDDKTCSLAAARSTEIAGEMAAGTLHSGMYGRNLPYWNTENAIALPSEEAAFNWWINEPIHRQAIESPSHTTSCVACSGNYCVQEFTSYQPK